MGGTPFFFVFFGGGVTRQRVDFVLLAWDNVIPY
jgi:hypothetical protein